MIAQLTAIVGSAAVAYGVLYNWAFFEAADAAWLPLFSLQDHAVSSIVWLPGALISFGIGLALRVVVGERSVDPTASETSERHQRWFTARQWAKIIVGAAIMISARHYTGDFVLIGLGFILSWHGVIELFFTSPKAEGITQPWRAVLIFGPVFAAFTAMIGYHAGQRALTRFDTRVELSGTDSYLEDVSLLKAFTGGLILAERDGRVHYIPKDQIKRVTSLRGVKSTAGSTRRPSSH